MNVSDPGILKCFRSSAESFEIPPVPEEEYDIEFDEMSHFKKNKIEKSGSGKPWTAVRGKLLAGTMIR